MNALRTFFQSGILEAPWAERIGWTLLHSLWQIAVIAGVYALLAAMLRKHSAKVRYLCGCVALMVMICVPVGTYVLMPDGSGPGAPELDVAPVVAGLTEGGPAVFPVPDAAPPMVETFADLPAVLSAPEVVSEPVVDSEPEPAALVSFSTLRSWMPWATAAWLVGVCLLSMRPVLGWLHIHRLQRHGLTPLSASMRQQAKSLARRLGVSRTVQFMQSALVEVPTVVGSLRPFVLLPASAVSGLSVDQVEMILAHELAHIRRHDYLVNLAQTVLEALLFFHPAMWWVSRQVRRERENCCDDIAVMVSGNREHYVQALTRLEEQRAASSVAVLAATGGSLLDRVRRLLGQPCAEFGYRSATAWLAGLAVVGVVSLALATGGATEDEEEEDSADDIEQRDAAADPDKHPAELIVREFLEAIEGGDYDRAIGLGKPGEFHREGLDEMRKSFDLGKADIAEGLVNAHFGSGARAAVLTHPLPARAEARPGQFGFMLIGNDDRWLIHDVDFLPDEKAIEKWRGDFRRLEPGARPAAAVRHSDEAQSDREAMLAHARALAAGDFKVLERTWEFEDELDRLFARKLAGMFARAEEMTVELVSMQPMGDDSLFACFLMRDGPEQSGADAVPHFTTFLRKDDRWRCAPPQNPRTAVIARTMGAEQLGRRAIVQQMISARFTPDYMTGRIAYTKAQRDAFVRLARPPFKLDHFGRLAEQMTASLAKMEAMKSESGKDLWRLMLEEHGGDALPRPGDFYLRFHLEATKDDADARELPVADGSSDILVEPFPCLNEDHVLWAGVSKGPVGATSQVTIMLTKGGTKIFRALTGESIGKRVAIMIDDQVVTAPVIRSAIGGKAMISGNFSRKEAEAIAEKLNSFRKDAVKLLDEFEKKPGAGDKGAGVPKSNPQEAVNRMVQELLGLRGKHPELARFGEALRHEVDAWNGVIRVSLAYEHNYHSGTKGKPAGPKEANKPWCRISLRIGPADGGPSQLKSGPVEAGRSIQWNGSSAARSYRLGDPPLVAFVAVETGSETLRRDVNRIIDRELSGLIGGADKIEGATENLQTCRRLYDEACMFLCVQQGDRAEAARRFRKAAQLAPASEKGARARELAVLLEKMAGESRPRGESEKSSVDFNGDISLLEELEDLFFDLRDLAFQAALVPGKCRVLGPASISLRKEQGMPAARLRQLAGDDAIRGEIVPRLLVMLDDPRPTRSWAGAMNGGHVLRHCDVALEILADLAGVLRPDGRSEFDPRTGRDDYLGTADNGTRREIIARVSAWWTKEQGSLDEGNAREARSADKVSRQRFLAIEEFARLPQAEQAKRLPEFYKGSTIMPGSTMGLSSYPHHILKRNQQGAHSLDGNMVRWAKQLAEAASEMSAEQVADQLTDRMWLIVATQARSHQILMNHPDATAALVAADLKSHEKATLDRAVTIIISLKLWTFTDQLMAMYLADDERSESAGRAMIWIRDPAIATLLLERVEKDPGFLVRCSGLFQAPLAGKPAAPLLLKLLDSPDAEIRYHAADALQECRDPELAQPTVRLAGEQEIRFRSMAARLASNLPGPSFRAIRGDLLPLLSDKDETVRFEALRCFGIHKDLAAGPVILDLLRRDHVGPQHNTIVMQAMGSLCGSVWNYDPHNWGTAKPRNRKVIEKFEAWLEDQQVTDAVGEGQQKNPDNPLGLDNATLTRLFNTGKKLRSATGECIAYQVKCSTIPESAQQLFENSQQFQKDMIADPFAAGGGVLRLAQRNNGPDDNWLQVWSVGPDGDWDGGKLIDPADPGLDGDLGAERRIDKWSFNWLAGNPLAMHLDGKRLSHYLAAQGPKYPGAINPHQTLNWGPTVDGLCMAVKLIPEKEEYALGEKIGLEFHVRNVSRYPITIAGFGWRQDHSPASFVIRNEQGRKLNVGHAFYSGDTPLQRNALKTGQVAIFKSSALVFLAEGMPDAEHPVGHTVMTHPGRHTLQFSLVFPDGSSHPDGMPRPTDWQGTLQTGTEAIMIVDQPNGAASEAMDDAMREKVAAAEAAAMGWSKLTGGLIGRLVVAKSKITTAEQFQINLELRNGNDGGGPGLAVQQGNPFLFEARVTDASGNPVPPTMGRVDVIYASKWSVIRPFPDEKLSIPVTIRSQDGAKGAQLDTTTKIWKLPPGKYKISGTYSSPKEIGYEGEHTPWAGRLLLPSVEVEVVAEEVGEAKTGVEAIDDVQVRLHSPQAQWDDGRWTLFFKTDLDSEAERVLPHYGAPIEEFFVEIDGEWFEEKDRGGGVSRSVAPSPATQRRDLHTRICAREWRSMVNGLPMPEFAPGHHIVRVGFPLADKSDTTGQRPRAVSDPVEITTGTKEDGETSIELRKGLQNITTRIGKLKGRYRELKELDEVKLGGSIAANPDNPRHLGFEYSHKFDGWDGNKHPRMGDGGCMIAVRFGSPDNPSAIMSSVPLPRFGKLEARYLVLGGEGGYAGKFSKAVTGVIREELEKLRDGDSVAWGKASKQSAVEHSENAFFVAKVVDADTGELIEKLTALAGTGRMEDIGWQWQPHTIHEFTKGRMQWPPASRRGYKMQVLRIEADGYKPYQTPMIQRLEDDEVILPAGATTGPNGGAIPNRLQGRVGKPVTWVVRLQRDPGVQGRALLPNGQPAIGAQVAIAMAAREVRIEDGRITVPPLDENASLRDHWDRPFMTTTDDQGRFTLPPEIAPAAVIITHAQGIAAISLADVPISGEMTLEPWGAIDGRVQWGEVSGAGANVKSGIRMNADGTFRIENVPPETYQLFVTAPNEGNIGNAKFTIKTIPGGESDQAQDLGEIGLVPVEIEIGAPKVFADPNSKHDGVIRGRIIDPHPTAPSTEYHVMLWQDSWETSTGDAPVLVVHAGEQFEFRNLSPGDYELRAREWRPKGRMVNWNAEWTPIVAGATVEKGKATEVELVFGPGDTGRWSEARTWGEAVDGVRMCITTSKFTITPGEELDLRVEIYNLGKTDRRIALEHEAWELEVNGKWLKPSGAMEGLRRHLPLPAKQAQHQVEVWPWLWENMTAAIKELPPGKHTIRVARLLNGEGRSTKNPPQIRIVSQPVTVEVVEEEKAALRDAGLPAEILPIFQAMKQEVVKLGEEYPQLSGAKGIVVKEDGWLFEHDCRSMGKRGYEHTGPFPVAIGLRVMTAKRFSVQVHKVAMSAPLHRWEYLGLVAWPMGHVGEGVPPVLEGKLEEVLKNAFSKIGILNRKALADSLPGAIQQERDRLLTEADAKIREGVRKLAETWPLLRKGQSWERLKMVSGPGRIGIDVHRTQGGIGSKRGTNAQEFPPSEAFSLLVVIKPPHEEGQMSLGPLYPRLGLVGLVDTRAANPDLDAALKKLVSDALAPLAELEQRVSTRSATEPEGEYHGVRVIGRVLDKLGGKGVKGITVTLISPSDKDKATRKAVTNDAGEYRIDNIPYIGMLHSLRVGEHGAGVWTEDARVDVPKARDREGITTVTAADLYAETGTSCLISGMVRDADTGEGVAGVSLRVSTLDGSWTSVVTDDNGAYGMHVIPREVRIECGGTSDRYVPCDDQPERTLAMESGDVVEGIDFMIRSAPEFSGRVLLPDGRPAANVPILALVRWSDSTTDEVQRIAAARVRREARRKAGTELLADGEAPVLRERWISERMDGGFGQDFPLQTDGQGRYHGYLRRPSGSGRGGDYAIEIVVIARTADKTLGGMEVIQTTTIDPPLGPSEFPLAPCGAVQFEVANPDGLPLAAATPMALSSLHDGGVTIGYEIPHVIPEFTNLGEGRYLATGLVPRWEYRMVVSASGYKCRDELKVKTEPGMFTLGSGEALIAGKLAVDWWGRKAVPGLIAKLNHLDRYQRQGACHELGSLGSEAKEAVQALIGALNEDKLNTVRFAAAEALGKIGAAAKAAVPSLIAALGRDRDGVPREAATALGRIRDPAAIPALTAALQHEEREVRTAAASALREIGPAVDLPSQYQDALNRIAQSLLKLCDTHPELVRFGEDVQYSNERVHHGAVIVDFSYEHNYIAVTKIKPAGPKIPGKPWCRIAVNIHPGNWEDRQMGVAIQEGEPAPSRIYRFSELPLIAVVSVESESEALRSDVNEIIDRELSVMCVAKPDAEEAAKPREAVTAVIREELESPRGGKPAGTGDGLPEQILSILQAMKQEVAKLGEEYPQLAGAGALEVKSDQWIFEHDCRFMGKRGYEHTGPFPVAIGLRVMTAERFDEQVDKVAMSSPGFRWEYLGLVGWPTLHVGEGVPPVLTGKLQEVLKNVFVKVGPMNREALAAGLPAGIQNERDRLLAEADAKIREGVRSLAETYPLLKKGQSWDRLQMASAPGRIGIHARRTQGGKGRTDAQEFPPEEAFSILVVVKLPPDEIEQLELSSLYPRLGLVGQVGTRAANPKLDVALKRLVADALAPLAELEQRVSGPIAGPASVAPATSDFRRGQSEAEAVKRLRNELSEEIQRSSGKSSIRRETRALIDALVERNVDIVSLLVGKCREGDVQRNSMIFEALRYVGSERSKAALLKIAQNRQYTDSYALGDRVAKAYMTLAQDSTEIAQLFSSRQPRVVDAALGGIRGCALTAPAVEALGKLLNSTSSWRHYHVSSAFAQDTSSENTERKAELLLANFSRLDHLEDGEKVNQQMGFTGYEHAYGSYLSALGNMPDADPFLLKSLGTVTQRQRLMLVMALGQRRHPVIHDELLQIVKTEEDGFIRWNAVESLRYIATKEDIPLLKELAANDPYTRIRSNHAMSHRPKQSANYHPVRNAAREIVSWLPTRPPQTDMELADYGLLAKTEKLDLRGSRVTDAGLVHLAKATKLKQLWLDKCLVTDAGLGHLKTLKNLESLRLNETRVTDRGLVSLRNMAKLKSLSLSNTSITDAGMVHLAHLTDLTDLGLDSTRISNTGLVHLNKLSNLELLRLGNSLVTDVGLIELKGLTKLERLILRGREVTDAWLVQLTGQKNLKWLGLGGTRVTHSGVAELERKMKNLDVNQY